MLQQEPNLPDYEKGYAGYSIDIPEYYNFGFDAIDAMAERDRNKLAMIWVNQNGDELFYTFRQLMNLSNQIANMLIKRDVGKGDRVLLMLPRVPEWWTFALAAIKLGVVFCPCPTMLTPQDLKYRVNLGKFRMVITDMENAWKVDEICEDCPSLDLRFVVDGELPDWISYPVELNYPAPASHRLAPFSQTKKTKATDPMVIFFTSGTTGEPKMVVQDHSYPLGHRITGEYWYDLRENDLHFTLADTGWAKSAWGKFFGPWICGACNFVYDIRTKFNPTEIIPLLEKYEITTFCAPPTIFRMLILADLDAFDLSELRHCVSAGEALNPEVIKVWKEATGVTIYEGYGQTETVLCIGTFPCMEPKPGSIGRPAPGWDIELHDENYKPVLPGEIGTIAIKTEPRPIGLFRGYLENQEATDEVFVNGFYYTGDKAMMDEDGYFWFVGRDDDVIKSSGYRIGPFEVESALLEHPGVKESAVIGVPDRIRGTIVKAFVILNDGYEPSDKLVREIQTYVKHVTAPYKYPRVVEFVPDLPKTISGKIKRKELREMELEKFSST
ncbi:MAG: acyl-CoA synthetase [Methanocalculus sp. MSAO_Arc1]|uniref:AMP-binding protein n=1 Tax=Methanocalculus TaxID=71151 RepID=UPI000FF6C98B|nr:MULTISPECIES: AMP-binding protein [unclassified Methanocalculus]MCP1661970.1 acetyl-CoA synthetase [Methanocalculus sp. AMF5]RQD81163.1 MAG: acyl-CoA synthetase [Methanocalculus sp. MSAO_Arc1]